MIIVLFPVKYTGLYQSAKLRIIFDNMSYPHMSVTVFSWPCDRLWLTLPEIKPTHIYE